MRTWALMLGVTVTLNSVAPANQEKSVSTWTVPTCATGKLSGKRVITGALQYVVPKGARMKKVKGVDNREDRVFLNRSGRRDALRLLWGVNASPLPRRGEVEALSHRVLRLPNGVEGLDSRGTSTEGSDGLWRTAGIASEVATYDDVSRESAEYFDAIINSMCYAPSR